MYTEQKQRAQKRRELRANAVKPKSMDAAEVKPIARDNPVPTPPFWGRRAVMDLPPSALFPYINETALFRGQWGFKQGKLAAEEFARTLEEKARPVFETLKKRATEEGILQPKVVYGYFPVQAEGEELIVYHIEEFLDESGAPSLKPKGTPREWLRFSFPRQEGRRRLCISDFFRNRASGQYDVYAHQLVTIGPRATELTEALRAENKYQDYLYVHGFSVESAEALAEAWHKRIRQELGFASEDSPKVRELFQQAYRGSRYSFGYPACPDLSQRAQVARLLDPGEIGVTLTESAMLIPEQSTDALVVHHPQAKYFDV
jgi:5-methyltetrahydrofolate--homocysteine methyltransferase